MSETIFTEATFEQSVTVENATLTFLGYERRNYRQSPNVLPQSYHTHSYAELFFCKSGEISLQYSGTTMTLHEGDAVFVPPKLPHFMKTPSDSTPFFIGITLKKKSRKENFDIHRILDRLFTAQDPVFFRRYTHILPEDMRWIEEIGSTKSPFPALSAFNTLSKLSELHSKNLNTDTELNSRTKKSNIIIQLENYIGGKYYENISAESLAAMLYISPRQLSRIVNEKYGEPLHRIIIKKRVECAAKLLSESNLSIEEISAAVGFDTKSCFYRIFKAEYGITPRQHRKNAEKFTKPKE